MKKIFTEAQLREKIRAYVAPSKSGSTTFVLSKANLANLVDKIGMMAVIDGDYEDKLAFLDGNDLPLGKTIEEYFEDLVLPEDFDREGSGALSPKMPTYAPNRYSYTLGRLKLKITKPYDEYERACLSEVDFADLTSLIAKRLEDSEKQLKYNIKKQGLGNIIKKCVESTNPSKQYASTTQYSAGEFVKKDGTPSAVGVILQDLPSSEHGDWDTAVKSGYITTLDLVKNIAKPTDTPTGEAFIKQVKSDIESAHFVNEHNSFNGRSIGASKGLTLFIKKGIMPSIQVDTLAGAFHNENLSLNCDVVVVDDFGDENSCYALLMDSRMARLHNSYRATRTNENGDGDFVNFFRHTENTFFYSANTFVKAYKGA